MTGRCPVGAQQAASPTIRTRSPASGAAAPRDRSRPGRCPGRLRARFSRLLPALAALAGALGLFAAAPAVAQSSDSTLRALTVEVSTDGTTFSRVGIVPEFSASHPSYETVVRASERHTHVRVTATANHAGATLKVGKNVGGRFPGQTSATSGSPSEAIALADGGNQIRIRVTAQDRSSQDYVVTVYRGGREGPAPPRYVKVTAGTAKLTLTWTAPAHWGSFPAGGYEVDWYAGASPPTDEADWNRATPTPAPLAATATSYEFTGTYDGHTVADGTTYQLQIRALSTNPDDDSDHLVSDWVVVAGTPPGGSSRSSDARLSALAASSATSSTGMFQALTLTPSAFSAATTEYTASVANARTHVKLTPTVNETNATVKVGKQGTTLSPVSSGSASGPIVLDVGANAITVRVTAEDTTTTKDYTVTVTRAAAQTLSTNANLSGLTAGSATSSGGPYTDFSIGTFGATTTTYTASVANDRTHVKLTPTVADTGKATVGVRKGTSGNFSPVTSGSASSAIALGVGSNTLVVRVTAEDTTTTKDYTVTVTRRAAQVSNVPTGLTLTAGDAQLAARWAAPSGVDVARYEVQIKLKSAASWPNTDTDVSSGTSHTFTSLVNGSTYQVRVRTVETGGGDISAWTTPAEGTPRAAQRSSDANLSALTASSSTGPSAAFTPLTLTPSTFSASTTSYTASVANARTHVKLTPMVAHNGASVTVQGSSVTSGSASGAISLDVGANALTVRVTAEDTTTTKDYTVTITRAAAAVPVGLSIEARPPCGTTVTDTSVTPKTDLVHNPAPTTPTRTEYTVITDPATETLWLAAGTLGGGGRLGLATHNSFAELTRAFSGFIGFEYRLTDRPSVTARCTWQIDDAVTTTPTVRLSASPNPVTEGSSVTVTATLSVALSNNVTIPLTITDDSAEPEDHGTLASIAIASGATSGTGTITTAQDADTVDETFTVALGALPSAVTAGSPGSVRIRIRDDDRSGGGGGGGGGTPDLVPSFGSATVADQTYTQNTAITALTLPRATGGDGALTYRLTPEPPSGLSLDVATRRLTGTPDTVQGPVRYTWTVRDADGDTDELTFAIEVEEDLVPSFGSATVADRTYTQNTAIATLTLPRATGGDGTLTYRLTPEPPSGLSLDVATRRLTGTPDTVQGPVRYTWTVRDADGDTDELTFTIEVEEDLVPSFGSATVADRTYTQNTAIATLTLPRATGGNGTLTYRLTPAPPSGLTLDVATRRLTGTPDTPQGSRRYTWTVRDADGDTDEITFAIAVEEDLMPSFGEAAVADQSWTAGTAIAALVLPEATGGDGALTYRLRPSPPPGLSLDEDTRMLTGTPSRTQGSRQYTWTATDADGDEATLTFAIAVAADPRRARIQEAVRRALAAAARHAMSGALDNIGARFGDIGASGMSLAGQWVPLEGSEAVAGAAAEDAGLRPCAPDRFGSAGFGTPDPGISGPARSGCAEGRSRGMTADELFGASAFSLHLGAAARADAAAVPSRPLWSVWGRGDLGTFAGRGEPGLRYDGELRTGWLGMDARAGRWVAGLAVSHGTGEADYSFADGALAGRGRLETALTSVYPYGRWTLGDGLELRGLAGAGWGEARHEFDDGAAETGDLSMRMASLGVKRALPDLAGVALAVRADGSVTQIETDDGPDAIHGLSAESWRLRAGLEASRRLALADESSLEPFLEAAVRQDGGDGLEGSGVELAGGLRYHAPGVSVEARGRWLAAHSEDGAEEKGVSLTARAGPGADGRGLFLALSPRWGAGTGGARALWREEMPNPAASGNDGAVDARIGYGIALPDRGLLTPFAEAGLAGGESRRLRLGTRFEALHVAFGMELAGERSEGAAAVPEHALRLDLRLRF